jgi:uncharacterized RDD family membrane protein YckC
MQAQVQSIDQTRYASLFQRFAAVTIDEIITLIAFVPAFIVEITGRGGTWLLVLLMVVAAVLRYSYFVYLEHHNGQTLGKRLFKIRVRSEREDRLPLKEALVRNLRRFDVLVGLALPDDPATADTAARIVVASVFFYSVVAPIFIWLSVKKQRPLDMLVHTIVVQAEQPLPQP